MNIESVAKLLGEEPEELERKALIAYLREELRKIRAEKALITSKYGVNSFEELWKLVEEGVVDDVKAHDDIVKLDYLEHREKELVRLIGNLQSRSL